MKKKYFNYFEIKIENKYYEQPIKKNTNINVLDKKYTKLITSYDIPGFVNILYLLKEPEKIFGNNNLLYVIPLKNSIQKKYDETKKAGLIEDSEDPSANPKTHEGIKDKIKRKIKDYIGSKEPIKTEYNCLKYYYLEKNIKKETKTEKNTELDEFLNEYKDKIIKVIIKKEIIIINPKGKPIDNIKEIMLNYRIPYHLKTLNILDQTLEEADNNLVYFGKDSKDKVQYFYGKHFIENRNNERDNIFKEVYKKMPYIQKYIDNNLILKKKNKITNDNLMAVLLLLELKTFIRTGRDKFLNENNTEGILSLRTKSIIENDKIIIKFTGKKGVEQYFEIFDTKLVNAIKSIYNPKNEFLFTNSQNERLSESFFYNTLRQFNVTLKNIRTYGVNILLLTDVYNTLKLNNFKDISTSGFKNLIKSSIEKTAKQIGHTISVSKKSYISNSLIDWLYDNKNKIIDIPDFDKFLKKIIKFV